jgi:Ca-activated chloride channel family protein
MRTFLAALALLFASAVPALADGLIVITPPPDQPRIRQIPLWVRSHVVSVKVEDRVAVTEVDQVFGNPNPRVLEGTYLFPLPEGATIDRFSMWIDGKETAAELLDADKARGIYEGIVRQMRDPALLEYAERGLFKARVYPIDANGEKRVRIRYAEVLTSDNGTVAYRYPLNTEKFSSRPLEQVSVSVSIDAGSPVASVFSPSHKIDAPVGGAGARPSITTVGWEARNVTPDRDFLLYWRPTKKDVGVTVLAHRDPSDPEGTFLLVLSPRPDEKAAAIPKDVVFVVDTSGSMAGPKMEQAKGALRHCLRSLGEHDRFAIVPFSTEPRPFREAVVPADAATRAAAEAFVNGLEAAGGTAIDDALRVGLEMIPNKDQLWARPTIVLFVTDGLPTIGETDVDRILAHARERSRAARLFVFGVGADVNTKLLDRLAAENRGARDYVAPAESIEEKVSNLYAKLAKPAMTDLELKIDGVATSAVHPRQLPDLFHGGEVLVAGRYAPGNAVVRLKGRVGGDVREIVEEVRFPDVETRHEFLPRLWAVRRVGFLLDQMRLSGETSEVRDETVRLARRFGIVTPFTSYLIVEDETRRRGLGGADAPPPRPDFGLGGGGDSGGGGGGAGAPAAPAATPEEKREAEELSKKARRSAGAKDDGAAAVDRAKEAIDLGTFEGDKDLDADALGRRLVRHVGGRTFVAKGGVWFDVGVDLGKARRVVEQFSDAYFELTRAHPEVAPWLQLGRVVVAVGDEVVEIKPAP